MSGRRDDAPDAGVSLLEVILAILLSSLILIAIPMVLVTSLNTQRDVAGVSEATSRGQGMGSVLERAMRNALAFDVSPDGTRLRVRTSLDGDLACQGFLFSGGRASIIQTSSALPDDAAAWTPWETGIGRDGGTPYLATTGTKVSYAFTVATDSAPVRIAGAAAARTVATGESAPCW